MRALFVLSAAIFICKATSIPAISFEELTSKSDRIVTGRVINSTTSWGSEHKYIWTRYEISVGEVLKGTAGKTVIVSEPGGKLDGKQMRVAGAVIYTPGERVALFLKSYGADSRTVGWAQGKFSIDSNDRVHPSTFGGTQTVGRTGASTPLSRLDGMGLIDFRNRVRAVGTQRRTP